MLKTCTICAFLLIILCPCSGYSEGSRAIYGVQKSRSSNLSGVRSSKNILGSKNSTKTFTRGSQKLPTKTYGASKFNSRVYSPQGGLSQNAFGKSNTEKEVQVKKQKKDKNPENWGNIDSPPDYDVPEDEDENQSGTHKEIGKF